MTSHLKDLKVYTTYPHSCSYLPNKEATTLFVDPRQDIDINLYTRLSLVGFRRSGNHIYRPHCAQCDQCLPARVIVKSFEPNRSQRRNIRKNSDLNIKQARDIRDNESYSLYARYIESRHDNGDMYPPSREQYESFLNNSLDCTRYYQFRYRDKLIAVSVIDLLNDGISAIYTFFDPRHNDRGLGNYVILWQLKYAAELTLDYVYLGYWIKNCRKMSYKSSFRPLQIYNNGGWYELSHH